MGSLQSRLAWGRVALVNAVVVAESAAILGSVGVRACEWQCQASSSTTVQVA